MSTHLLLSAGNGPKECRLGLGLLITHLTRVAEASGLDCDISVRGDPNAPSSALFIVSGSRSEAFAADWEGTVMWRSGARGRGARKNFFLGVFRLTAPPESVQIPVHEITFTSTRAGGPGGQHVNTTDSAVRAAWTSPIGKAYAVFAREERSQHRNRALAIRRLSALVAADEAELRSSRQSTVHALHHRVERGNPRHVFEGEAFEP